MELIEKRDEKINIENERFKKAMAENIESLEEKMRENLQDRLDIGNENFENWKSLTAKKLHFENMHKNLLEMKRNMIDFNLSRKSGK